MVDPAAIARNLLSKKAFGVVNGQRITNNMSNQNALKASNHPNAKREGLSSILDRNIRRGDVQKNREALGEGAVTMRFYDETNALISGEQASLRLHDVVFTADSEGNFRLVDEGYLEEKVKEEEQKRDYIDKVTKMMVTDEVFIKTLGIPEALFNAIAESEGGEQIGIPDGLRGSDARPSVMESYVGGSQLYMMSLAKQRCMVRRFMPILQTKSETKTGALDAKDSFGSVTNAGAALPAGIGLSGIP